jgi:hypothetical protein
MKILLVISLLFITTVNAARIGIEDKDKKQIETIFSTYVSLHKSFFTYNKTKVQGTAKALKDAISMSQSELLQTNFKLTMKFIDRLINSNKRAQANKNFGIISMNFVSFLEKYAVEGKYNVYECPMVQKKGVHYTVHANEVQNPYAPEMPNCGRKITKFDELI